MLYIDTESDPKFFQREKCYTLTQSLTPIFSPNFYPQFFSLLHAGIVVYLDGIRGLIFNPHLAFHEVSGNNASLDTGAQEDVLERLVKDAVLNNHAPLSGFNGRKALIFSIPEMEIALDEACSAAFEPRDLVRGSPEGAVLELHNSGIL